MIWKFNNCNVYGLGSVHLMGDGQNNHVKAMDDTFSLVSRVVFETSLDFGDLSITRYENEKLSDNISKSLFRDVKKVWTKYGLKQSGLEESKIWSAALSIGNHIFTSIGLDAKNGVDRVIWGKSIENAKKVEWLEDQLAGLQCFDSAPIEELQKSLTEAARNKKKLIGVVTETIASWNAASEERLLKVLHTSLKEYPSLFNCLIYQRNNQWKETFLEALGSTTPTLFVVGALHCVGDQSILDVLDREYGFASSLING